MGEFVSGSRDAVIFWDSQTLAKKSVAQPFDETQSPSDVTWNLHNSKLAVVPSRGDSVAMFDSQDRSWTHFKAQTSSVPGDFTCGCLLRNSKFFASGSSDAIVRIWDIKKKSVFKTCRGHSSAVTSICRSHRDNWVVSGGDNGAIVLQEMDSTSEPIHVMQEPHSGKHDTAVTRLKFSVMEKTRLGSASYGDFSVWSAESKKRLMTFSSHSDRVTDFIFSPTNNMLTVSVGMDGSIKCYDVQTRKSMNNAMVAPSPLTSVALLKEGVLLVVGADTGVLYVYDLRHFKKLYQTLRGHTSPVTCISLQNKSSSSSARSSPRSPGRRTRHNKAEGLVRGETGSSLEVHSGLLSPLSSSQERLAKEEDEVSSQTFGEGVEKRGVVTNDVLDSHSGDTTVATHAVYDDRVMATPISDDMTHLNSIFSPIDANMVTPLTRHLPIATVAMPSSTTMDTTTYTYHPTHAPAAEVTTTTTLNQPLPALTSSSTPITTTGPAFSCATPSTNATPPLSISTETSGLFSPLESSSASKYGSSRQPVASPLLIAHTKGTSGDGLGRGGYYRAASNDSVPAGKGTSKRNEGRQLHCHQDEALEVGGVSSDEGGTVSGSDVESTASTGHRQLPEIFPSSTVLPPSSAVVVTNHTHHQPHAAGSANVDYPDSTGTTEGVDSGRNILSTKFYGMPSAVGAEGTSRSSSAPQLVSGLVTGPASDPLPATAPSPGGIQMKFIENFIRESHEETREMLHGDIRAINVDFIKIFHSLLHQMSVLTERVDKLTQDMEYLKSRDPLYQQYMPKH